MSLLLQFGNMSTILTILPEPARLYTATLAGIKRRLGTIHELRTVDYRLDAPALKRLLDFWNPAGCIIAAAQGFDKNIPRVLSGIPAVYLDRSTPSRGNILDVMQDYEENGRTAARELISIGLDNYAFIGNHDNSLWSDRRGRSFADSIRLHGKKCHIFRSAAPNYARQKELKSWLLALPKPVGIFAANDFTAKETHDILTHGGVAIPDNAALLGIDNISGICESVTPGISSIASDFERGGWLCADLLLERIANPSLRRKTLLYPSLGVVRRASTLHRPGCSRQVMNAIATIHALATNRITVDDVAAAINCSRRIAEIRFKKETGRTIREIISDTKLERVRILLQDRNLSIKDIAPLCGYATVNAMRIAFKNKYGIGLSDGRR